MKLTSISILVAGVIIAGAAIFSVVSSSKSPGSTAVNNPPVASGNQGEKPVVTKNDTIPETTKPIAPSKPSGAAENQVLAITAKGGYNPRIITAKADMPTTLRVETNGTFDCSSGLNIPTINYHANLPPTGITEIPIPPQKAGTSLTGICSMGMYNFSINFN